MAENGPILSLSGVTFARPGGFRLGPVELGIRAGEILGLLGPNGAGKSTLLELAAGCLLPEAGEVRLFGRAPGGTSRRWVAQRVAVLPQRLGLPFALTVRELVFQGRWPHLRGLRLGGSRDREIVRGALEQARVLEFANRDVRTLSGGELQRVLLAKAIAQEPKLLLLDEPTASLDPGHVSAVLGPLVQQARREGVALLLATHDITLAAAVADRVLLLDRGRCRALGSPAETLTEQNLRETYAADLRVERDPSTGRPRVWLTLDAG